MSTPKYFFFNEHSQQLWIRMDVNSLSVCTGFSCDGVNFLQLMLSSACTAQRPSLLLTLPPQEVGSGWARGWEVTQPGQLTWIKQWGVLYHVIFLWSHYRLCRYMYVQLDLLKFSWNLSLKFSNFLCFSQKDCCWFAVNNFFFSKFYMTRQLCYWHFLPTAVITRISPQAKIPVWKLRTLEQNCQYLIVLYPWPCLLWPHVGWLVIISSLGWLSQPSLFWEREAAANEY